MWREHPARFGRVFKAKWSTHHDILSLDACREDDIYHKGRQGGSLTAEEPSTRQNVTSQFISYFYFPQKITSHQWAVYDAIMQIPKGKVTTYKHVAEAAGGSARSGWCCLVHTLLDLYWLVSVQSHPVGGALRSNPFAPFVPCHRVIASNLFIGGFFGEWGKEHKTGTRYNQKMELLIQEGVYFDDRGHLKNSATVLWTPKNRC